MECNKVLVQVALDPAAPNASVREEHRGGCSQYESDTSLTDPSALPGPEDIH